MKLEIDLVDIEKQENTNFILGHSHFIKTVEDIHEALVNAVPGIKFGLAFCEASGDRLIRWSGTDHEMIGYAIKNAQLVNAGHTFVLFLGEGFFPINVLRAVQSVPEVVRIHCATANPTQVIVAESDLGRGVLGVIDGEPTQGVEDDDAIAKRKSFLRTIGYKLS